MRVARLRAPEQVAQRDFEIVVRRLANDLVYGVDESPFAGAGIDYMQSRLYVPGDPVRQMDWKVTARTGKPHIKEYEATKRTPVRIIVDTSASMASASTPLSKHDLAVWLAAVLGLVALKRLSPAAIIGAGERETRAVPSLRTGDLWRELRPLKERSYREGTRLALQVEETARMADRESLLIVISDMHEPGAVDAVKRAVQRHECFVIQPVDPLELGGLRGAGFLRASEAETGHGFVARARDRWFVHHATEVGRALASAGADHIAVRTDEDFVGPLARFLRIRGHALGGKR